MERTGESRARGVRFAAALLVVAVAAALFAIAFRALLHFAFRGAYGAPDVVAAFEAAPGWARVLLPCLGGLAAGLVVRASASIRGAQSVGEVMEAVVLGRARLSPLATVVKSLGSFLAIVSGGSLGREGPLIQFGGAVGDAVARAFRIPGMRARGLIAAGTAAGFAAAYNTPFAAVLFVLEVVTGIAVVEAILPTVVAVTIATALTRAFAGGGPIYGVRAFSIHSQTELIAHALLGIIAALAAILFMRLLSAGEQAFSRTKLPQPLRAGLGGLLVGAVALFLPQVTGNGYEPLAAMLDGTMPWVLVVGLLLAKPLATTASVSSGSPGGVFTPTLLLGAAVGTCFGGALVWAFGPDAVGSLGSYALVGMAATTAATTHAPLLAAVLVFELSGDYAIVLPLLLSTALATVVSRRLHGPSLYAAELERRGVAWTLSYEGRRVRTVPAPPRVAHDDEQGRGSPSDPP